MKKKILLFFSIIIIIAVIINFCVDRKDNHYNACDLVVHRFEQDFFSINPDSFDLQFSTNQKKIS